jgi:NAD(P)-dependent dehydrogenase (short-subunit alcohol dehydrogenase family)
MTESSNGGSQPLAGTRVLLVGASSGIGRALAVRLVGEGARVVMAGRRIEELEKTVGEAAGGLPVCADVTSAADCARLVEAAREHLGRIDILISSVGVALLRAIADTDAADWLRIFEINVVGFHQLVRACLPLLAPDAIVAAMSSESVDEPRAALGAYVSSKVALERGLTAWRTEHPGFRFCRIRVGSTFPTEFGRSFDGETLERAMDEWAKRGLSQERFMTPEEVAGTIAGLLSVAVDHPGTCLDELTVRSPSAVVASFDEALDQQ